MFALDSDYLQEVANSHREEYSQAQPFPHIVIDNFLPEFVLNNVLNEFPDKEQINWKKFNNNSEKKLASKSELDMGEATRMLLYQLNSSIFINFLEMLTGIDGIIPDPHFVGGGLHQIERGGYLKMHVDFNKHTKLRLDRRLNVLIYLNQDWKEEYGGHLELWDKDMTRCEKKILPIFNRFVVFNTTNFSYHGHPDPLMCPEEQTRKSLALYYYSNGRPPEEASNEHSTVFKARNGEQIMQENTSSVTVKTLLKQLVPPIFITATKYMGKKF
jgi:Rps23 Pro-64 3,4-dihydroxylase Tpa1-like proline 4-hydroxylase